MHVPLEFSIAGGVIIAVEVIIPADFPTRNIWFYRFFGLIRFIIRQRWIDCFRIDKDIESLLAGIVKSVEMVGYIAIRFCIRSSISRFL